MTRLGMLVFIASALVAPVVMACTMVRNAAADTTAEIFDLAAPAFDAQSDYEFAGQAAPGSVLQIEGILRVRPNNEELLLNGAKGWTGYAFGYVEDAMEQAELAGDMDEADRHRARARAMYLRGRDLGLRLLEEMKSGTTDAVAAGPDRLREFLARKFKKANQAPALFWAGYAWGSAINVSLDDPALIADLSLARTLVERSVELDDGYYHGAGLTFLGYANSIIGEQLGGNPARGREYFEQALARTERRALMVQLNYARSYAVQTQNRSLFEQLLREAIDAPADILPEARLPNEIAKRRAARYLARIDELFDPEGTPADTEDTDTEATE